MTRLSRSVRNARLLAENANMAYAFSRPTPTTLHGLCCRDLCLAAPAIDLWKAFRQTSRKSPPYCRLQAQRTDAHMTTSSRYVLMR